MSHTGETRALAAEVKFLVPASAAPRLQQWARTHLQPDPHGAGPAGDEYAISTLYLDTPTFDVFERRGSFGRAKYRIRRYGQDERVFLERKLRKAGVLVKRRTAVGLAQLEQLEREAGAPWEGTWFARRIALRGLGPVCRVRYQRMARVADTPDGPLRLTLDSGLVATSASRLRFSAAPGTPILAGMRVLELKFRGYMPGLFRRLVEEFALVSAPASKYRIAVAALDPGRTAPSVPLPRVRPSYA